jgi:hypothetical protein
METREKLFTTESKLDSNSEEQNDINNCSRPEHIERNYRLQKRVRLM